MFQIPTIEETRDRQLADIRNALPSEAVDTSTDSDNGIRASAAAGVADGLYAHQSWILRQIFPDTAEPENLALHARTRNIFKKQATASAGQALMSGTPGKAVEAGHEIRADGLAVVTTTAATIGEDGKITVSVRSKAKGANTNTTASTTATLVSPPDGVNSTVTIGPLTGGTDEESNASLLARYLDILRRPPAGGNKYDYKRWALEVEGVTSAYVEPMRRGLGTVDVAITSNNDTPPQELVDAVQAYIEDLRPVTAKDTLVLAPTKRLLDFVVAVKAGSGVTLDSLKPQIESVIADFMDRLEPGEALIISQLETQISLIPGVSDRKILSPDSNVQAVIDVTTWEWLRAGEISVEPML